MIRDDSTCDYWSPAECEGNPHCPPRCPRFVDRQGVPWTVRPVEPGDRTPLLELYREFAPGQRAQGLPPLADDRLEAWVDSLLEEGCNVVAERDGRVVGHALYTPTDAAEPELAVFVHQDVQRRGLGTELCRHVVANAAAGARDGLVLEVSRSNRTAIGIYERLGFERIDGARSGEGLDRRSREVRMRLSFPATIVTDVQFPPAFEA